MTTAGRGPPQNLTTVSHFSVFRAFRRGETLEKRSGPLILTNVSHFWTPDPSFQRMFHTFGHPTRDFDECFTLFNLRLPLRLAGVLLVVVFGVFWPFLAVF